MKTWKQHLLLDSLMVRPIYVTVFAILLGSCSTEPFTPPLPHSDWQPHPSHQSNPSHAHPGFCFCPAAAAGLPVLLCGDSLPCVFWILPMAPFWTGWFQSSTFPCFCCELYLSHCQLYLSVCCSWVNPFQLKSLICCELKYLRKYFLNSIHDHACVCQTEVFGMEYNYNLNFKVNLSNSEDKLIALIIHTVKGEKCQHNLDPTKLHKV